MTDAKGTDRLVDRDEPAAVPHPRRLEVQHRSRPGDKVSVTLNPIRTGEPGGIFVSVTLADGRVLGGRGGGPAAPPAPAPAQP